ncbi:MAG TPA: amidohydrolase family protein [Candidatus Acidoferrales bacterium]|nr:amidohydrolase family protein [Candidatus Acidoferrales bacterium]
MDDRMISADDHIDLGYLPKELWLERVPKSLRERAPRVEDRGEKGEFWVCDGETWGEYRGARWFARPNRNKLALDRGGVGEPSRPTTPEKRLADMDRDGIEASLMFPPILAMQVNDPELRNACVRAYNDWAAEFRQAAPTRFFPVAMLSPVDPEAAKEEICRVAKMGFREANFLVNDVTLDMYMKPWDVFWDAAEETGLVVSYHVGGSLQSGTVRATMAALKPGERQMAFDMGLGNGATSFFNPFVNLFNFGTLERHPNLKFCLAESGIGWIPFVVQEMDYRYRRQFERKKSEEIPLKEPPSEIFKRQVWATYQTDLVGLHLIQFFGDGHIMWGSDYPHPDSTWPFSKQIIEKDTAHLSPEMKKKVTRDNAAALYRI